MMQFRLGSSVRITEKLGRKYKGIIDLIPAIPGMSKPIDYGNGATLLPGVYAAILKSEGMTDDKRKNGKILTDFYNDLTGSGRLQAPTPTRVDSAMKGGIDFNSANLNLQIKRDGHGVPLPVSQQDLENIHIDGLIPVILSIKPANTSPLMEQFRANSP
jgi:hypothetical protein